MSGLFRHYLENTSKKQTLKTVFNKIKIYLEIQNIFKYVLKLIFIHNILFLIILHIYIVIFKTVIKIKNN